jgi:hypothetical protein
MGQCPHEPPGLSLYDPKLPWVSKVRVSDGEIACDLFIYVDDGRVTAPNKEESRLATRQAASRLSRLGIHGAPRKRRWADDGREPGRAQWLR